MANGNNPRTSMYSLEDYGIPTFGETSAREQREAFEANQDAVNTVARNLVVNRRIADQEAAKQVYGEVLGSMYEGDRKAVEFMRNDIMTKYNSRQYARNPEAFAQAVANLNALIENSEAFYTDSYGNTEHLTSQPQGLGTGTTFVDAKYNSLTNNEALTNIGKEPAINVDGDPIDLFAEANGTFENINKGTEYYDANSMFMKDGELYVTVNKEEVRYQDLEYRTLGGLSYLPNLRDIGGQLEALAKEDQTWNYISHRNGKWNEKDALDLFVDGMTNMQASDKAFRVAAWNSVAEGMGIKPELRQTFIDTGSFGDDKAKKALFTSFSDEVKRVWLEATKREERVTPTKPKEPTQAEIDKENRRADLVGIAYVDDSPQDEITQKERLANALIDIGKIDGFEGDEYARNIMQALQGIGVNPSAAEVAEGAQNVVELKYNNLTGDTNEIIISFPDRRSPNVSVSVDGSDESTKLAIEEITTILEENNVFAAPALEVTGQGIEWTLPALYEDEAKIIVASRENPDTDVEIRPNKVVFFQETDGTRGDMLVKNAFYDDGTAAGTFVIKKGSRNYDTALRLLDRAIKTSYGEDLNIDMFFGLEVLPANTGGGAITPAP